jgi:hypothetical protein
VGPVRAPVAVKAAAQPVITPPTVQPVMPPASDVPQPVAAKPQPAVSVGAGQGLHKENWFAARWKLIAGIAVGLVLLLVAAQSVIRNQNEKAATEAAQRAALKDSMDKGSAAFDRNFYEQRCGWGVAEACGKTAVMYWEGRGTAQDRVKALALYRKACDGGYAASCEALKTLPDAK